MKASIFRADDGGYWLETPYQPDFVRYLKLRLPKYARKWNPERRMWWVAEEHIEEAIEVVRRFFDEVTIPELVEQGDAWAILWLRPGAPPEVIKAAYRTLAVLHHPDHGGDKTTMQRINLAYERLSE